MGYRYKQSPRHFKKPVYNQNRCDYCNKIIEGLPHRCKFCGESHCPEHLLPENHNCNGLKPTKSFADNINTKPSLDYSYNSSSNNYHKRNWNYHKHKNKPNFNLHMPRFKLPRINNFFMALILVVVSYFLATNFLENNLFLWLETAACFYLTFIILKPVFKWANRISMADDLSFFGLRILGGIVVFVGIYFGFSVLLASVFVRDSAPITIPLICLVLGLIFLGAFIAFRTNRRHNVVGVWRA